MCGYSLKKRGGGSYVRVQLEERRVIGAGQVQKGGSLPRYIPILNIYVIPPPPPGGLYPRFKLRWCCGEQ